MGIGDTEPSKIMKALIEKFEDELGTTPDRFHLDFGKKFNAGAGMRKLINGDTTRMRDQTAENIVAFFAAKGINIDKSWLLGSFTNFSRKLKAYEDGVTAESSTSISLPRYDTPAQVTKNMGIQFADKRFMSFRFAFENTGRIAKELIYFYEEDDRLKFDFYFRVRGADPEDSYCVCTGEAFAVGNSICLMGIYHNDETGNVRPRFMILGDEQTNRGKNRFRHGILTSNSPSSHTHPDQPSAVKVLLVRQDEGPESIAGKPKPEEIMREVSWIEPDQKCPDVSQSDWKQVVKLISNSPDEHMLYVNTNDADKVMQSLDL